MPRNMVMSPFSYVAFELCMKLMENGQEVIGIEPSLSGINKGERDEKELYLGRNANWTLHSLEEFSLSSSEESVLYVCHLNSGWPSIQEFLEEHKGGSCKFVYITTPDQCPFTSVREWSESNVWIQLPSIYGSWQPEGSFFERSLLSGSFPFKEYEKENRQDILYIDDAVNAILEIAELQNGTYQVRSRVENHWYEVLKKFGYTIMYDTNGVTDDREQTGDDRIHYTEARIKPDQGVEMLRRHMKNVRKRGLFPR